MNPTPQAGATCPHIEPLQSVANAAPYPWYEQLAEAGDVVWDEAAGAWLVSSFKLLKELSREDGSVWRRPWQVPSPAGTYDEHGMGELLSFGSKKHIFRLYGEEHDRVHHWWIQAFSPPVMAKWRESTIAAVANEQIDNFVSRGRADLWAEFSSRVTPKVMARMLGIPSDDATIARITSNVHTRGRMREQRGGLNPTDDSKQRAYDATRDLAELFYETIRARRQDPQDDLISLIWRDAELLFGPDYSEVDVLGTAGTMWEAGTETTAAGTGAGIYLLLTRPEMQQALVEGDGNLLTRFVEEAFRLYGPVGFRSERVATRDTQVGDVLVKEGEKVIAVIGAADRDARQYECPAALDLERPSPKTHLAFWTGRLICAGQGLGRAQVEENVLAIARRLPDLRFDPDQEHPRFVGHLNRSISPMHARFTPVV